MNVKLNLDQLGLKLPTAPKPIGNYVATVRAGDLLFISGQLPIENGQLQYAGQVGSELTEQQGYVAAQFAALNVLAQIESALGSFDRLAHLVRVEGHVASAPEWHDAPKVLDGASDLFVRVLGKKGQHTRSVFSPTRLPKNAAVELVVVAAVNQL
jgi:enamine deaminase RidA (YjgF/YER057c/UK114 family)